MVNRKVLEKNQALYAIENGEFGEDVTGSKDVVVVIMTQDWCPQWKNMQSWVYKTDLAGDFDIYELVYNKVDYSSGFMGFKETQWKNDQIPYLRYYRGGRLFMESNYVGREKFEKVIQGEM